MVPTELLKDMLTVDCTLVEGVELYVAILSMLVPAFRRAREKMRRSPALSIHLALISVESGRLKSSAPKAVGVGMDGEVGVGVRVWVAVGVLVAPTVGVRVSVLVCVGVNVRKGVWVRVGVRDGNGVQVGVEVRTGVLVGRGGKVTLGVSVTVLPGMRVLVVVPVAGGAAINGLSAT